MSVGTERLSNTAKVFSRLLKASTSLELKKRSRVRKLEEPNGWYQTIALLEPGQKSIDIYFDNSLKDEARGFWVGFTSENEREIFDIVAAGPLGMDAVNYDDTPDHVSTPICEYPGEGYVSAFGIYFSPGEPMDQTRALSFVCEVLQSIPGYEHSIKTDSTVRDQIALEGDPSIKQTEKLQLMKARVGQGDYRTALEKLWGGRCSVLGVENRRALRASHVKPWADSTNEERLDPENGLLLSAHLDALFDAHLITFNDAGGIQIASTISEEDRDLLKLPEARLRRKPSERLLKYLKHHQNRYRTRETSQ